jgi:hypothetical protein
MIAIPLPVIAAQWVLLFALAVLVIMFYRQLAFLMQLEVAGTAHDGLAIGNQAPAFDYFVYDSGSSEPRRYTPGGRASVVTFVDVGCAACEDVLSKLAMFRASVQQDVDIVVVTSARVDLARRAHPDRHYKEVGHVRNEVASDLYSVRTTPFVFVVNGEGKIVAKAAAPKSPQIDRLLDEAMSAGVASAVSR